MTPDKDQPYVVIARKWRPRNFEEVIGQEHVSRTLTNAITRGRVAHAYLFTGPRGVGKTTVARVLAKSLNCAQAPTINPCSKCAACTEIAQGTSLDVLEIDGASNRGIDEIRNLRESVRYAPVGGKKKVYIIDEVHMLTQEAFNALLKTLEEPPPHVVFVFATTQPLKVPQTIVSRCQRFDFRRVPASEIAGRLSKICEAEGYRCDQEVLARISQRAEGSMRDAESMLEQVLAFGGGAATESDIRSIMGLRGSEVISEIARAVIAGDQARVMGLLGDAFDQGVDALDLTSSLIEWIRYLLIASIDLESRELLALTDEMRKELADEVKGVSTEYVLSLLSMVAEAEDSIKRASHQRYLVESIVLRMANVKSVVKISDLIDSLKKMQGGDHSPEPKPAGPRSKQRKPSRTDNSSPPGPGEGSSTILSPSDLMGLWQEVVEGLRETKASLASILDLCEPPDLSEGVLWLHVPSEFHRSQVHKGQNLKILTQQVEKLTNTSVVIKTRVKEEQEERISDLASVVSKDPVVRSLIESLGGKVIGIRQQKSRGSGTEATS